MKKSALTILFLTMFLVMLSLGVILPHLAYYAEELGASATQIGFLISIYSAMKLIFAPVWGRLSVSGGYWDLLLPGNCTHLKPSKSSAGSRRESL
ncbi:hypothetical protein C6502_01515 [Candidatus Poribacteria bacterium]|nr:MAG: hypothetical protein C6502_01515 [Candidatus Poribacteria bacterium]